MIGIRAGLKALAVLGAMSLTAACASYPTEPRYSIHAEPPPPPVRSPHSVSLSGWATRPC